MATRLNCIPSSNKKISKCPKPILLHTSDNCDYILFIDGSDGQIVCYDIERKHFFLFCEFADLELIDPLCAASSNGDCLFIFDGHSQSFAMMKICIDEKDALRRPKISKIRKTTKQTAKLRNLIKTGSNSLCIYLPDPWNEFHIIGGSQNCLHLKWDIAQKQFVNVANTAHCIVKKEGINGENLMFCSKFGRFILMTESAIHSLSYPSTKGSDSDILRWGDCQSALPYKSLSEFGAILFRSQFVVCFGGIIQKTQTKIDQIFIFDIERNEWTQSSTKCPSKNAFYAVFVDKTQSVHLFERYRKNDGFGHFVLSILDILKETKPFYPSLDYEICDDQNDEIKNAEECDDGQQNVQSEIVGIKEEISLIWDFITSLKNDMMQIKQNQIKIIQNSQLNSHKTKKRKRKKNKSKNVDKKDKIEIVNKPIYDIFDSDIDDDIEDAEDDKKEQKIEMDTKNLSLIADNVEYESLSNSDNESVNEEKKEKKEKILKDWLTQNRLSEYFAIFVEKGHRSLSDLQSLDEDILLTQIGISKLVHRRKLMAKLKILQK